MQQIPDQIRIVEVGPRDGLQFESKILDAVTKIEFVNQLSATGLSHIEVGSFVSPKHVPQLADSEAVFNGLLRKPNVLYSALVPNDIGLQRAMEAKLEAISVFTAASETFCQKNIGCSIEESLDRFDPVIELAKASGIHVRAYISCVLGCPYEGSIKVAQVVKLAQRLIQMGCDEISLGDTIGVGTPSQAQTLVLHVGGVVPLNRIAVHFHDTRGQALANIMACLDMGITTVDASVAGLGGCPYAEGASGNVATEDVVYMLNGCGIQTGIDLNKLINTGNFISEQLDRMNNSRVAQAGIPAWIEK
jgi:hydroxymethylglutaryl-CoA lyase